MLNLHTYCTGTGDNYDVMAAQKLNDSTGQWRLHLIQLQRSGFTNNFSGLWIEILRLKIEIKSS